MVQSRRNSSKRLMRATAPRQISIAFESRSLQGMSVAERLKALMHLANLLTLAAGLPLEEKSHEPR